MRLAGWQAGNEGDGLMVMMRKTHFNWCFIKVEQQSVLFIHSYFVSMCIYERIVLCIVSFVYRAHYRMHRSK